MNKLFGYAGLLLVIIIAIGYSITKDMIGDSFVNIITMVISIFMFLFTLLISYFYIAKFKEKHHDNAELKGDEVDGISKYDNDNPIGWSISYVVIGIFVVWYIAVGFPLDSYSSVGEYNEDSKIHNEKFDNKYSNLTDEDLANMGENLYMVHCSACHGVTGDGLDNQAADLTKWSNEEGVVLAILNGSKGLEYPLGEMPAGMLDEQSAKKAAAYVMSELSARGSTKNPSLVDEGKEMYDMACAACHGANGDGMDGMSPDLTKIGSFEFVVDVLERGKTGSIGVMPSYKKEDLLLSEIQQKSIGVYVNSLAEDR